MGPEFLLPLQAVIGWGSLQREPRPVCLEGKKGREEEKLLITVAIRHLGTALYLLMTLS